MVQQWENGFTWRAIVWTRHGSLRRILPFIGLRAGSELVTANFERDFLERFRQTGLPQTAKILHKARQEFDLIKTGVGDYDEPEFWDCPVEGLAQDEGKGFLVGLMRFSR